MLLNIDISYTLIFNSSDMLTHCEIKTKLTKLMKYV